MTAPAHSTIVRMSKRQLEAMIDRDARRTLGISGQQFRKRLAAGTLSRENGAVRDIAMLVKLVSNNNGGSNPSVR